MKVECYDFLCLAAFQGSVRQTCFVLVTQKHPCAPVARHQGSHGPILFFLYAARRLDPTNISDTYSNAHIGTHVKQMGINKNVRQVSIDDPRIVTHENVPLARNIVRSAYAQPCHRRAQKS